MRGVTDGYGHTSHMTDVVAETKVRATAVPTSPASQTLPEIKVLLHACISMYHKPRFRSVRTVTEFYTSPSPNPLPQKSLLDLWVSYKVKVKIPFSIIPPGTQKYANGLESISW